MVQFPIFVVALVAASVNGAPLTKRIAQVISASTTKWEQACDAAGGDQQCNQVAVTAFGTLLAAPGPCEQQNAADSMIDLAKQLNNDPKMISLAQIFAQQPRNTPSSQSVPYCQQAPKNSELNGLFQCQFKGADATTFVGGAKVGSPGTIPFGMKVPLDPAGSCKANPSGPIADGTQLVDLTEDPGVDGGGGGGNGQKAASGSEGAQGGATASATSTASSDTVTSSCSANSDSGSGSGNSTGGSFKLQNGKDAQKLNAGFQNLDAGSSCTDGELACVSGDFAQCVGGKFTVTPCAGDTTCVALPLVNKPGTSIACTTQADAQARMDATGVTGGISGRDATDCSDAPPADPSPSDNADGSSKPSDSAPSTCSSGGGGFQLQNGKDAQKLNASFQDLSAGSACNDGDQACVSEGFAQCVGGKFSVTPCAAGTSCFALPLVNKPGTSITCTTESDAKTRIEATCATGGISG